MNELERDIERKLRQMVAGLGGHCLKWVCPGWSGVPDRIVLLPGGRIYFVELKRPMGGQASVMQKWWAKQLHALGFTMVFIKNEQELAAFGQLMKEGGQQ